MKQSLLLALALVSAVLLAVPLRGDAATVYRWIGGASGNWQDAANWSDAAGHPVAAAPSGDDAEAWIDAPSARAITVNGETSVGRVRFLGTGPLTLTGSRLSVTGVGATQTAWSNECPVVCNVPLTFAGSTSVGIAGSTVLARAPVVFNGAIDATGSKYLIFYSKNAANDARITFNAAVTAPNATVYFEATGSGMTVNAPVSAKNYSCSTIGQNTGTVQLYAPVSLSGGALTLNYRALACMRENIFGETVHVNWSGWYEVGCLQMNGFDQTLDYLTGTYLSGTYAPREGNSNDRAIVSTVPATLTLRATQSASAPVRVRGQVSIVYDPLDGASVQTFTKRPSDTLGTIDVRRGTVCLDDGATFARLSALTVGEGAAFELRTKEIGALLRLSRLDLAKNARLTLADGVRQVFYDGRVACTLAEGARLELPTGYTFRPQSLVRAGRPLAARTYTGRDNPTPDDAEPVDWIVGAGRVELTDGPCEPEPAVIDVAPGAGALDEALEQVVAFRQTDVLHPVEIRLRPGRYPLASTLKIDERFAHGEWAPLVIGAADPADKPHLEAGAVVAGWKKGGFAGRDDVWTADVSGLPLLDPCRSLLFNSRWMTPARWPNRDPARPFTVGYARAKMPEGLPRGIGGASVAGYGIWQDEITLLRHDWKAGGRWANPTEGWVRVAYRHNWSDATYRISGVTDDGVIKLNAAHVEPESRYYVWDHYCVFNLREELDAPGEWYWDRAAGKIHFIPPNGENPNDGLTVVDTVDKAIEVSGAGGLRLENLEISGGRTAVSITADDITVRGCAIHDCGQRASAIVVKGHRVTVSDNDIWNVGGTGVSVNEMSGETLVTDRMDVRVDNNYIHHCGLTQVGGTGISFRGQGVSVTHNLIHDCSRHGIGWNGRFNEVGWNRIRHVSYGSDDTAAIYGGGWCQGVGVRIHHNHFSDAYGYHCNDDGQYVFNALCSGIYPDEGSAGLTVDHNFVHGCHQGAMHLHNGRWITISNNVFVSNSELPTTASTHQLSLASWDNSPNGTFANRRPTVVPEWQKLVASDPRWLEFPAFAQDPSDDSKVFSADGRTMMGVQVVQNVFCYPDQGGTRLYNCSNFSTLTNRLDRNLVWPGADMLPKVGLQGKDTGWTKWQALGEDVHSVVGDPQFADLANGDLRFVASSPARTLGIEELTPADCGLVTNAFRPVLPVEAEGVREHPEWLVPVVDRLDDARVCRWTGRGGDGLWSTAANWDVMPMDGAGDHLVFDTAAGVLSVTNDLSGFSIGSVRFQGSSANAVTISGREFVLMEEAAWSNEVPVTVNAPIRHMSAIRRKATFGVYDNLTLNGSLSFEATTNAVIVGYRRAGGRETCTFNGDITGVGTTLELRGANAKQIAYDFRGKLTLAGFRNGCNYGAMTTTLYNPSNEIAVATGAYQPLALADDALHGTVFLFDGYYREMSTRPLQLTSGKTYVLDRISETGTLWEKSGKPYADAIPGTSTTQPITLVLRGTGDATSACSFGSAWNAHWQTGEVSGQTAYPLSLTWDPVGDFTQEFRNRTHLMKGDITVKGGTLRSAGTNVFQNVTTVTVCSGATLDVASTNATRATFPSLAILAVEDGGTLRAGPGTNPFAVDSVAATLSGTAKISVDPSATLNIGHLTVGGAEIKSGSYTGMPWMTGGGTVKVSGCVAHVWGQPTSGEWGDASKWIGGVPTADSVVKLSNGGSYAVTLAANDVVPKSIEGLGDGTALATVAASGTVTWRDATFEIKAGARLDVPTGASLVLDATKRFKVGAGGELRVSGGVLSVTNNVQPISVVGMEAQTARVSVVSGTLRQSSAGWNGFFSLGEYGVLEQTGGRFEAFPGNTGWRPVSLSGGVWRMSGNAVFEASSGIDVQEIFGTGSTVFSGSGTYNVRKGSSFFKVTPGKSGETAQLTLKDHAGFKTGSFDGFQVGATAGGKAVFEVDTDAVQCKYGIRPFVGVDNGDGELILRRGYVATGYRGLAVGVTSGNRWGKNVTGVGGHGIVRVTGGSLYIPANNPASDENIFNGLLVGEASMTFATDPTGDGIQRGEFHLASGSVTNRQGIVIVGGARAIGTFEQTGGVFLHNTAKSSASLMTIGLSGGRGSYLMGGGVADIRSDVYVGGCLTNAISGACYLSDLYPYPTDRHDAAGTLTVTGGVMTCTKNVYVGADGTGTVAVVGRAGELNITKDLVLSNTTATATAAVLTFAFGADGVAPIAVGGKVVNTSGTKLVVDVGAALTKIKNHRLIRCTGWEGPEITDVTFAGACAEKVRLMRDAQGLLLTIPPPLVVIIR